MSMIHGQAMAVTQQFGLKNLTLVEKSYPAPPPHHALVKLSNASLNYRDLLMIMGLYNPRQPLPLIPCSDGVGEVVAIGEGCALSIGERVLPLFSQGWQAGEPTIEITQTTLGGPLDGTLATHICLAERGLVRAPDYLTDPQAGTLSCAALTAWSALIELGQLKPGDRVLCIGTGGVSLFATQIASHMGAEVFLTSRSEAKLDRVADLDIGAHHLIHTPKGEKWGKRLRGMTDGGVDHVVEVGGAGTLSHSLSAVRPGGTISLIGVLSGGAAPLNLLPILMRQVKVQGVIVGHRESFERMLKMFALHKICPVISERFSLYDAPLAFECMQNAEHIGKIDIKLS